MRKQDAGFDCHRYQQLVAEAVDEKKRLEVIAMLIAEHAKDRLAAHPRGRDSEYNRQSAGSVRLGPVRR